jgi:hypothetical protein
MPLSNEKLNELLEGRPDESLDEAVHDIYSQSASGVNNGGYEEQATYLRSEGLSNEEILEAAGGVVPLETTSILTIEINFDSTITDEDSVGVAVDNLLETALSTPDILAEYGNPGIGQTYIQPPWVPLIQGYATNITAHGQVERDQWLRMLALEILSDVGREGGHTK